MRILGITNRYPRPGHDTVATYNREQFRALARCHDVRIIAPLPWTDRLRDAAAFSAAPCRYRNRDGIWVDHPTFWFPPKVARRWYGHLYLSCIRKAAESAIDEFRPDAILACWAHPDGWAAVRLARATGLPVLVKVIGSDVLVLGRNASRRRLIAEALAGADGILAVSRDLADHVVRLGVDPRKVHVVPEGLDRDVFCPGDRARARERVGIPTDGKALLFVGNVLASKGVGVLIDGCGRLRDAGDAFRCYLVGSGPYAAEARAAVARLGLGDRLTLVGPKSPQQLPDWYRASDLVVLPSFSEGIPNVLREAVACGRPFVATKVGGIPEIAEPPFSCLVEPGDAAGLAMAVGRMLRDTPVVTPAVVAGHSLSWDESAAQVAGLVEAALPARYRSCAAGNTSLIGAEVRAPGRRLRVLAITNLYPRPGHPTIATYNREQFRALAVDHDVRIIAPVPWTDRCDDLAGLRSGPRRYRNDDGTLVEHPTYFFPPKVLHEHWGPLYVASIRRAVARAVEEFEPDVILAAWAHPDGWAAVRLAREFGLPAVIKVHGSDVLVATRNERRRRRIAEGLREADGVIAVSRDLADHVVGLGVPADRVHVVHNGIDEALFTPGDRAEARARLGLPADGQALLFVGNLLFSKGIGVLADACARLRDQGRPVRCYVVGGGRDEGRLRALVARHGLGEWVTLVGPKPSRELPDWYRACDLVALPSYSEGIPNVLREAVACGRPFVATRVGGIPEVADPAFSQLVDPGDPVQLAAAVAAIFENPPAAEVVARLGRAQSWEASARSVAARLRGAISAAAVGNRTAKRELDPPNPVPSPTFRRCPAEGGPLEASAGFVPCRI